MVMESPRGCPRYPGENRVSRFARTTCVLIVASIASTSIAVGTDQDHSDPEARSARLAAELMRRVYEPLAAKFGDRAKQIGLDDPFAHSCPQVTSLLSSAGDDFGFIVAGHSLDDADPEKRKMVLQIGPENSPNFSFSNKNCRYRVTVRKFELNRDGETEVG